MSSSDFFNSILSYHMIVQSLIISEKQTYKLKEELLAIHVNIIIFFHALCNIGYCSFMLSIMSI